MAGVGGGKAETRSRSQQISFRLTRKQQQWAGGPTCLRPRHPRPHMLRTTPSLLLPFSNGLTLSAGPATTQCSTVHNTAHYTRCVVYKYYVHSTFYSVRTSIKQLIHYWHGTVNAGHQYFFSPDSLSEAMPCPCSPPTSSHAHEQNNSGNNKVQLPRQRLT